MFVAALVPTIGEQVEGYDGRDVPVSPEITRARERAVVASMQVIEKIAKETA